jgi:hypothetical protein
MLFKSIQLCPPSPFSTTVTFVTRFEPSCLNTRTGYEQHLEGPARVAREEPMSELELNKSVPYLRATLKEALLDLNVRQSAAKSLHEVIRDSRIVETLLLVLDRLEALEGKLLRRHLRQSSFRTDHSLSHMLENFFADLNTDSRLKQQGMKSPERFS